MHSQPQWSPPSEMPTLTTAPKTKRPMHPGRPVRPEESRQTRTQLSCRCARLRSAGQIAEEAVYATVAQRMHHQIAQGLRRDADNVGPGECALRELHR